MADQLGIHRYFFSVYTVISFICVQFIFSELNLAKTQITIYRLIIVFLMSLISLAFYPIVLYTILFVYPNFIFYLLEGLNNLSLHAIAYACEGDDASNARDSSRDRGESTSAGARDSSINRGESVTDTHDIYRDRGESTTAGVRENNRRRSASPLSRNPLPRSVPLPYQYRVPTGSSRLEFPFNRERQSINTPLAARWRETVQPTAAPMGLLDPFTEAMRVAPSIAEQAMQGVNGYLSASDLFDEAYNAYDAAED